MAKDRRRRKPTLHCIIITGLSGAGKTIALRALEDLGIFCVDNLPLQLLPSLMDLYVESGTRLKEIAVGLDVRVGALLDEFPKSVQDLSRRGITYKIIYLQASDEVVARRFSETRRRHPLGKSVDAGIAEEKKKTQFIREIADRIIDTTVTNPNDLKDILSRVIRVHDNRQMAITVTSFGYKYGIPSDSDIVLDVRFLPNPNYVPSLKRLTGLNGRVEKYVMSQKLTKKFLKAVQNMLDLTVPEYVREGKSYLTVSVGCTGGRHRSVALAEYIKNYLARNKYPTRIIHRDIRN